MAFRSAYLCLTLAYSKGQSRSDTDSTANVSKMVTDGANITIAIKYEVTYVLSISIFKFDLSPF